VKGYITVVNAVNRQQNTVFNFKDLIYKNTKARPISYLSCIFTAAMMPIDMSRSFVSLIDDEHAPILLVEQYIHSPICLDGVVLN
jgi:hypothetical protein